MALLAIVQVSVLAYAQLSVTFAAREAARQVAVDPSASVNELGRNDGFSYVVERPRAGQVRVIVRHEVKAVSVLFAPFLDGYVLESTVMQQE